ncbi:hypothetical protein FCIRC_9266 [Fusarium circinatum]|uniref:Uncharacterized protein n=1 Tax=Fusarium circinatum TaxID=48490 RepID=A0A8H5TG38_FUSCI|nr:hypothetical protein FCIRC_9266 [Fusarium circinatum]
MAKVYLYSAITLAAAASSDAYGVFFANAIPQASMLYASELYPEGGPWDLQYRYKRFDISDRLPSGVQSVEDCRFKHIYTELLTRELNSEKTVTDEEMFLYVWASVVAQYSVGKLTKEADKLIAIDGVAEQLTSIVTREQYLNGLWRQDSLPLSLLWSTIEEEQPPNTRVAPSWSWASVHTPVNFNFLFRAQTDPKVVTKVIDIITPDDEPESVEMSRRTALVLQGPLTETFDSGATHNAMGNGTKGVLIPTGKSRSSPSPVPPSLEDWLDSDAQYGSQTSFSEVDTVTQDISTVYGMSFLSRTM